MLIVPVRKPTDIRAMTRATESCAPAHDAGSMDFAAETQQNSS
jgi:hypothetical protein